MSVPGISSNYSPRTRKQKLREIVLGHSRRNAEMEQRVGKARERRLALESELNRKKSGREREKEPSGEPSSNMDPLKRRWEGDRPEASTRLTSDIPGLVREEMPGREDEEIRPIQRWGNGDRNHVYQDRVGLLNSTENHQTKGGPAKILKPTELELSLDVLNDISVTEIPIIGQDRLHSSLGFRGPRSRNSTLLPRPLSISILQWQGTLSTYSTRPPSSTHPSAAQRTSRLIRRVSRKWNTTIATCFGKKDGGPLDTPKPPL